MKNKIQKHLLNNKGDIYMYFLFFMIAVILMFSAVFGLMQLRIMSNHIYTEIETSADVVFANIKKECYQTLIDGTTENTVMSQLNTSVVMNQLAEHLDAEIVSDQIIKQDESRTYFIIRNLIVSYEGKSEEIQLSNIDGGLLKIKFDIEIPVKFNGGIIYTVNKTYTKNTMLNFK